MGVFYCCLVWRVAKIGFTNELGKFLCYVIEFPRDDVFGISRFLDVATIGGGEEAEVYLSHAEITSVGV